MTLKNAEEIEIMTEGGRRLGVILSTLAAGVRAGMTTRELDRMSYQMIHKAGAKPAFLHYQSNGMGRPFPYTLCASVNDVIVHAQPSTYVLKDGDVLKLDLGLKYKGYYLDSAVTIVVGGPAKASAKAKKLIAATREALEAGVKAARPGNTLGDVGAVIEKIAKKNKLGIAEGLTGHGIGRELHEDPHVFNVGKPGEGEEIKAGMVIAIEPMFTTGKGKLKQLDDDGYASADGSLTAHFEHTVAIGKNGPKIITQA
jgi:methionyl aminopeptidase